MKILYWDSTDPLDCFDNPNCRNGDPSYRLEPGDPGYVPWPAAPDPPAPTGRTSRHRHAPASTTAATTTHNQQTHTMSIPYHTRPTSDGTKVTTAIAYRGTKTRDEIIAEIAARLTAAGTTLTPEVIGKVLLHHDEAIIDFGMDAWKCDPVGHIGHYFTGGGASTDLQGPWTYDTMNIALTGYLDDDGDARAAAAFTGEALGHKGRVMPIFARVCDTWTKQADHYTAGKSVLIELGNRPNAVTFDIQAGHKVQWRKADGTLVDADDYGFIEGTRISARVPTGITGDIHLVLTLALNGRLVTDTYEHALTT